MRSIFQHLRFPFSFLLLPVFLFAIFLTGPKWLNEIDTLLLFIILHLIVYPASNAFNSLQDQDTESIGLIKSPLPIDPRLSTISIAMDVVAILLSLIISLKTAFLILIYILISRLYSYRKIRLKQYPIIGFLVVFIFQGAWIFYLTMDALDNYALSNSYTLICTLVASCFIGSIYPLSQIYQHDSDIKDGVTTISYQLGKKGTFIFSGILFLIGSLLFLIPINPTGENNFASTFILFQLPSLAYFNYWFYLVLKNESAANFKHTMRMSLLSASCMNAFFLFHIISMKFY